MLCITTLFFCILALGLQLFSIGQLSGTVSVAQSLIGRGNQLFRFFVRAQDRGDVPKSSTMELSIKVISTEENDGNPQWFYPPMGYTVYVPEVSYPNQLYQLLLLLPIQ